jgi:hypothetical protein
MLSLRQAASTLGCDVKTLKKWMDRTHIEAVQSVRDHRRWELSDDQVRSLRRFRDLAAAEASASETAALRAEIARLSAELAGLRAEAREREAAEKAAADRAAAYVPPPSPLLPQPVPVARVIGRTTGRVVATEELPADIPPGSTRLATFAQLHGVSNGTATTQQRLGTLETISRPDPTRPGYQQRWVTLEQQRAAVAIWRARGQLRRECTDCPHDGRPWGRDPHATDTRPVGALPADLEALIEEEG